MIWACHDLLRAFQLNWQLTPHIFQPNYYAHIGVLLIFLRAWMTRFTTAFKCLRNGTTQLKVYMHDIYRFALNALRPRQNCSRFADDIFKFCWMKIYEFRHYLDQRWSIYWRIPCQSASMNYCVVLASFDQFYHKFMADSAKQLLQYYTAPKFSSYLIFGLIQNKSTVIKPMIITQHQWG